MEEQTIASQRPFEGKLISVRVDTVALPSGRTATREIVEHPGAVGILPWDGARLALVRQWRHATGAVMLEIPAGTLEPDESPRTAAERELAEECGHSKGHGREYSGNGHEQGGATGPVQRGTGERRGEDAGAKGNRHQRTADAHVVHLLHCQDGNRNGRTGHGHPRGYRSRKVSGRTHGPAGTAFLGSVVLTLVHPGGLPARRK